MMLKKYIYHTYEYTIHKGPAASCPICKRLKKTAVEKTNTKASCKKSGRTGGKKRDSNKKLKVAPPVCSECGKKIDRKNKTGLCIICYNKSRASKKGSDSIRICSTEGCNNRLNPSNQTGLCHKCFTKSEYWNKQRKPHGERVTSAIRSRGDKDSSDSSQSVD